jgi:Cof subfamily protein (haloacid dehalogenase superfamily)
MEISIKGENMIKLIASDMDGTLLDGEGRLSEEFFEIFEKLQAKGIKFAAASGRQYFQLRKSFERIKDSMYFIAENGTLVKYKDEEIFQDSLPKDIAIEIINYCKGLEGVKLVVCGKSCAYVDTTDNSVLEEFDKYYFKYKVVKDFDVMEDDILKIAVLDIRGAEEHSYKVINDKFGNRLQVIVSGPFWIDIFNTGTNKGTAIKILQQRYNITPEETMVFGDYYNDVQMLNAAYHSYAMENAPEDVKKHARFIASSNCEDGVLKTIKKVLSI